LHKQQTASGHSPSDITLKIDFWLMKTWVFKLCFLEAGLPEIKPGISIRQGELLLILTRKSKSFSLHRPKSRQEFPWENKQTTY